MDMNIIISVTTIIVSVLGLVIGILQYLSKRSSPIEVMVSEGSLVFTVDPEGNMQIKVGRSE